MTAGFQNDVPTDRVNILGRRFGQSIAVFLVTVKRNKVVEVHLTGAPWARSDNC